MAKTTINHSCGHSQVVELYGPLAERERKIEWLEREGLCTACYRAAKDRERIEAAGKAADANQADCLPALEGTPKQIAWAEQIRAKVIPDIDKMVGNGLQKLSEREIPEGTEWQIGVITKWHDQIRARNQASWWIERRDCTAQDLLTRHLKAHYADQLAARGIRAEVA